jgi:hypothetical protein
MYKTRNWAFVLYPESAPANWQKMLADLRMKVLVSPLHDKDVDGNGEFKKAHHHGVLIFDGPQTQKRANEIIAPFNGTKSAEYVNSLKGYVRYLAHLDDPDKALYDPEEIMVFGGVDLADLLRPTTADRIQLINEIFEFCNENSLQEFSALVEYARSERRNDWLPVLVDHTHFIDKYLTSRRYSQGRRDLVNKKGTHYE